MECKGKKISELEERSKLTGSEYIVFQDQDYNGKIAIDTLSKALGEHVDFAATATAVEGDTASAEVELVANTFNFKFQLPKGEKGNDGQDGSTGTIARPVFAYIVSEDKPSTPVGGYWDISTNIITYPKGWSSSPAMDGMVWMSQTVFFADGTADYWSEPICITGKDGENGKDGELYQYIYTRTTTVSPAPPRPVSSQTEEVPTGWFDNPQGITQEYKVEWTCVRTKAIDGQWSDYSTPTIWSRWGENGKDGDGVEYIYTRTTQEVKPDRPTQSENKDEYIPPQGDNEDAWYDNPIGVDATHRWEWVSIRKQKNPEDEGATWGTWSDPSLWAYYAKDGSDGASGSTPDHQSFFFKDSEEKPAKPTFTNPLAPAEGWVDSITGEGNWWCCVASVDGSTGLIVSWSEVFSVSGVMFRNVNAYKSTGTSDERPETPTGGSWNPTNDAITYPDGWSGLDELGGIVWESQATFNSLGSQTKEWSIPTRITGPNGENGTDGLTIEFIYTRTSDDTKPELVLTDSENVKDYLPGGDGQVGDNPETWIDNPRGITDTMRTEWMSQREKDLDTQTWGDWIEPIRWSRWGQNGKDGDGVEYVFVRTKREQTPTTPTDSPNVDEYEPPINESESDWVEGPTWVDDPVSPTTEWKYVYVSQRKQQSPEDASATWGAWSTPSLWAMYGHTGDSVELRMRAHNSATEAPALDKTAREPAGWTVGNPVVDSTNKYVWMTAGKINTENELVGEWSDPWNTTGEDGKGGEGGAGEPGPMGPQGIPGVPGVSIEVRYSKGTDTEYEATWNATVRTTRDPSSYGWTIMAPSIDKEQGEKLWFIQARIGTRYTDTGTLETETYLEDGAWNEPSLYGSEQGADGIGITSMNTYYTVTDGIDDIPDKNASLTGSIWEDTAPDYNNNTQVLWQLFVVNYTNGVEDRLGPTPIIPGVDGKQFYTWIKYADDEHGNGISNNPTGKNYIGFAYNKETATESDNPGDYMWSDIKGEEGQRGPTGADGTTYYTWIKYSANSNGSPIQELPDETTKYIGIAVNKLTSTESNSPSDYTWSLFKGADGVPGTGITEIYEEYYLSDSPTELTGGTWSRTWSWQAGKYTWQRTTVKYSDGSSWTSDPICASGPSGDSGEGNAGPIVYPAGVYDITKTYYATSQKAPYVFDPTDTSDEPHHTGNYYFLNDTSVSGWTGNKQSVGNQYPHENAESDNPSWVKMESFDAMYANIGVFGNALVGSAVFNGDFIFSQQGKNINDWPWTESTHYENFNADFIKQYMNDTLIYREYNTDGPINELDLSSLNVGQYIYYWIGDNSPQRYVYEVILRDSKKAAVMQTMTNDWFLPNFCVDLKTGAMITSAGKCKFNKDGSGKLADGNVSWDIDGNVTTTRIKQKSLYITDAPSVKDTYHISRSNWYDKIILNIDQGSTITEYPLVRITIDEDDYEIGDKIEIVSLFGTAEVYLDGSSSVFEQRLYNKYFSYVGDGHTLTIEYVGENSQYSSGSYKTFKCSWDCGFEFMNANINWITRMGQEINIDCPYFGLYYSNISYNENIHASVTTSTATNVMYINLSFPIKLNNVVNNIFGIPSDSQFNMFNIPCSTSNVYFSSLGSSNNVLLSNYKDFILRAALFKVGDTTSGKSTINFTLSIPESFNITAGSGVIIQSFSTILFLTQYYSE